jgi:hypothetical protein
MKMKKVIKTLAVSLLMVPLLALGASAFLPATAGAETIFDGAKKAQGEGTPTTLIGGDGSIFNVVVNILLFVIGAISVIMLIVGGIRYTISAGNATQVTAAKSTIMYAIIGLIIAFLAYAIVNWVLTGLGQATTN